MKKIGKNVCLGLVVLGALTVPMISYGATIRSTDIYAADGTSGQTLTTGTGIKTGHIQNSAVTGAKIASSTITGSNVAAGAITDSHISGKISGSKLGTHTHSSADITGIINIANIPLGTTAGTVAPGDHNHDALYQKKLSNVIIVAKSGGDFSDPVAAMNSITDASISKPYLVKILPGVYDIAQQTILMKQYVDIEGSGENVTTIKSTNSSYTLYGASKSTIRQLSIETTGGVSIYNASVSPVIQNITFNTVDAIGIQLVGTSHPVISNSKINVSTTSGSYAYGIIGTANSPSERGSATIFNTTINILNGNICYGVSTGYWNDFIFENSSVSVNCSNAYGLFSNTGSTFKIKSSKITTSGEYNARGIYAEAGGSLNVTDSEVISNSSIMGGVGAFIYNGATEITSSIISGNNNSIDATGGTNDVKVANSKIDGLIAGSGFACINNYSMNYSTVTCP